MSVDQSVPQHVEVLTSRLKAVAGVVAPSTLITALLFYFGYVATLARFRYFGVYLDLVNLSTQQMLLYGVEVAYVPLTLLELAAGVAILGHVAVRIFLSRFDGPTAPRWFGATVGIIALLAVIRALVGIVVPDVSATETPGITPLSLMVGALLTGYAGWVLRAAAVRARPTIPTPVGWYEQPGLLRSAIVVLGLLVIAGLFWSANSFAAAYGVGRALDDAAAAPGEPEVILQTKERLYSLPPQISRTEQRLPVEQGQQYRYQYRGLRLLVSSGSQLFLIPALWTETEGRTVVIRSDSEVRIQLDP
jgi:hypothetical protein